MNFWFVSDGKVMPSWLEIHEISIGVVSNALNLSIFFVLCDWFVSLC